MNLVQIDDWRLFFQDGGLYLKTARNAAQKRREVFTPEILYNLTAMAIEKYLMAYLMYHGDLADNHTMEDLARAVEKHAGPQPELTEKLLYLDSFQEICHVDTYKRLAPSPDDIPKILAVGENVREFVTNRIQKK